MEFLIVFTDGADTFNIVKVLKLSGYIPHQYMLNTMLFEANDATNVKGWMDDLISKINLRGKIQIYQYVENAGYTNRQIDAHFQSTHNPELTQP